METYAEWKVRFMEMMSEYKSMWDEYLGISTVGKYRINLNPSDALHIHATPNRAGPRQRQLEIEKIEQMFRVGVDELATKE